MAVKLATDAQRVRWLEFVLAQSLPLKVECEPWRASRSNDQNAMLWSMYAPIADHMGYDRDDVHEWMCGRMWGWKDIKVPKTPRNPEGLASVPVRTTTRNEDGKRDVIDKAEFSRFVDMVERIAAQSGVFVSREAA